MQPIKVTKVEEKVETKVETSIRSSVRMKTFFIALTCLNDYSGENPNKWLDEMAGRIEILDILQSSPERGALLTIVYREINS